MNKKVLIDTDVILDLLCKRELFYDAAAKIFTLSDKGKLELYSTSLSFANIFYILRKSIGNDKAKTMLRKLRLLVKILPMSEKSLDLALNSKFTDFEDALQYFASVEGIVKVVVTRNVRDYKEKELIVLTPEEFIAQRG